MSMPSEEAKAKVFEEIRNIKKINKYIKEIVVSHHTGIPVASEVDVEKEGLLSAAVATIIAVSERISGTLTAGVFNYILMDFEKVRLFLLNLNQTYRILVIAEKEAPIGLVLRDVKEFASKLAQILS